jgi:hypothetical protein
METNNARWVLIQNVLDYKQKAPALLFGIRTIKDKHDQIMVHADDAGVLCRRISDLIVKEMRKLP